MKQFYLASALSLVSVLVMAGCESATEKAMRIGTVENHRKEIPKVQAKTDAEAVDVSTVVEPPGEPTDVPRKREVKRVNLTSDEKGLSFDLTTLTFEANTVARIVYDNRAPLGSEIWHDVVILKPGTEKEFMKRLNAADYKIDNIPNDPAVLARSNQIQPGESGEVFFFAKEPGTYPYVCTMQGHAEIMNMRGVIEVLPAMNKGIAASNETP